MEYQMDAALGVCKRHGRRGKYAMLYHRDEANKRMVDEKRRN